MALKFLVNSYKIIQNPILQCYNPILTNAIVSKTSTRKRHFFAAENIEEVPEVLVDKGKFKFLLIYIKHAEITQGNTEGCKAIVRGFKSYKYHDDLFNAIAQELRDYNLIPESAGGGIIDRDVYNKTIYIYGTSMKYGKADFKKVAKLLKFRFPFYKIFFECEKDDNPISIYKDGVNK